MPAVVSGVPVEGLADAAYPGQLLRGDRGCRWLPIRPVGPPPRALGCNGIGRLERLVRGDVGRRVQHGLAAHRLARVRLDLEDCVAHGSNPATMLEATTILLANGPCEPELAPKPLLGNGQPGEDQQIFVGRSVSAAVNKVSERPDDPCLHGSSRACRDSPVAAFAFPLFASSVCRMLRCDGRPALPPCCRPFLAREM